MPKFMIIDENGKISRTINLPYDGIVIDISSMSDEEWLKWCYRLHEVSVEMEQAGIWKRDENGLPIIS